MIHNLHTFHLSDVLCVSHCIAYRNTSALYKKWPLISRSKGTYMYSEVCVYLCVCVVYEDMLGCRWDACLEGVLFWEIMLMYIAGMYVCVYVQYTYVVSSCVPTCYIVFRCAPITVHVPLHSSCLCTLFCPISHQAISHVIRGTPSLAQPFMVCRTSPYTIWRGWPCFG